MYPPFENNTPRKGGKVRQFLLSNRGRVRLGFLAILLAWAALFQAPSLFQAASLSADSMIVRQTEGSVHGFLALRTLDGAVVADGDSSQMPRGRNVTNHLVYRFKDGSVQDETIVFSQTGRFRLLTYHLVQKGPVFKRPMDVSIQGSTGVVTVRYQDDGKEKTETARMKLPPDLANGMVPIVLKNLAPGTQSATASMIVATPKPLLIKLVITAAGEDSFSTSSAAHKATRYNVKVDIPGIRGVLAPLVGKQPPDTSVWILGGDCPAFVRAEGPLFEDSPIWRTELVSPTWPKSVTTTADKK